jgi:hypothetical protein
MMWEECCEKKKDMRFNLLVDLTKVINTLWSKWVMNAFEINKSNHKWFLRYKLRKYQSHKGEEWAPNVEWCMQVGHMKMFGSTLWNRVGRAWVKMVKDIKNNLRIQKKSLVMKFWWNAIVQLWANGLLKHRATKL